jgi:hypothetical protein
LQSFTDLKTFVLISTFLIFCSSLQAQEKDSALNTNKHDSVYFVMKKDPFLAIGLSAILPGAGQVYNGQWWKTPIIFGAFGGCIYGALLQNHRMQYTQDSIDNQLSRGDDELAARYSSVRDFYRDDRDKFYIYAGLVYIANLLDAYISAHLFDFDVSDTQTTPYISAPFTPEEPWRLGVRMRW